MFCSACRARGYARFGHNARQTRSVNYTQRGKWFPLEGYSRFMFYWEGRLSRIHFPTEFISTISWVAFYVRSKDTCLGGRENWSIGTWQRIKTRKTTSVTSPATQAMFLLKTNLSVLFVMRIKIECKISYLQYKENQTTVFCFWRAWKIKK